MVRLMLVRHAQSRMNAYQEELSSQLEHGRFDGAAFNKAMRDGPPGTAAGDDAELTELGHSQAGKLAEVWGPLLVEKARRGKLFTFVSPFLRALQTADPLMSWFSEHVPGYSALLLPAIMEYGGLADSIELRRFDRIDELARQGKRKEAMDLFRSLEWEPQGLSARQARERFPWARVIGPRDRMFGDAAVATNVPEDSPWWTGGYESTKRTAQRVDSVVKWILGALRGDPGGDIGDDAVVVMVSHGGMIEQLANILLHYSFTEVASENNNVSLSGIRNTSVTMICLPSRGYKFFGERPNAQGEVLPYRCKLEFFNDTSHLGSAQLRAFAVGSLSAKL